MPYIAVMHPQATRQLSKSQIDRLEKFRIEKRYTFAQLNLAIARGFSWRVLRRAMKGDAIWDVNYFALARWIEEHLPSRPALDGKAAAAGETR